LRGETVNEREQREQKAKEQRDQRQNSQGPRSAVTHEDY
jgi:hypothetical protein